MFGFIIACAVLVVGTKLIAETSSLPTRKPAPNPVSKNVVKKREYNWGPDVLNDNAWYRGCYPKRDGTYIIRCEVEGHDTPAVLIADYHIINGEPRWSVDFGKVIPGWYENNKVTLVEWSKFL